MLLAHAFCISLHTKYIFPRLHAPEGNIGIVKQLKFLMCPINLQYRPLPRSSLWPDSVVSEGSVIYSAECYRQHGGPTASKLSGSCYE